jgi:hypothetical protein
LLAGGVNLLAKDDCGWSSRRFNNAPRLFLACPLQLNFSTPGFIASFLKSGPLAQVMLQEQNDDRSVSRQPSGVMITVMSDE